MNEFGSPRTDVPLYKTVPATSIPPANLAVLLKEETPTT